MFRDVGKQLNAIPMCFRELNGNSQSWIMPNQLAHTQNYRSERNIKWILIPFSQQQSNYKFMRNSHIRPQILV